jgi:DNA sulfur modification protein DndE
MLVETLRISDRAKSQLITLKRRTGIENWNVLCRWAFCISLKEKTNPRREEERSTGTLEIAWRTFAGDAAEVYMALLQDRCNRAGIERTKENLTDQLRLHVERGIGYLAANRDIRGVDDLLVIAAK